MNEQLFSVWDELRIVKVLLALVYSVFYHVLIPISRFVFQTFVKLGYGDVGDLMMATYDCNFFDVTNQSSKSHFGHQQRSRQIGIIELKFGFRLT